MTTSRRDFVKVFGMASLPLMVSTRALAKPRPVNYLVKHFVNQTVTNLLPIGGGTPLPSVGTFMKPGTYIFKGFGYDCTRQGLYCFWDGVASAIESRIVGSSTDPYPILSAICWHHVHGVEDESFWFAKKFQELANAGRQHKWRLRCGAIVDLTKWVLPLLGYKVRRIQLLTQDAANGVDDGHVTLEVWWGDKWCLWDLTNSCYFTYNDVHLSAEEIIKTGVLNCTRVPIDNDDKVAQSTVVLNNGTFCFSTYHDTMRLTPAEEDAWFARIYQSWYVF